MLMASSIANADQADAGTDSERLESDLLVAAGRGNKERCIQLLSQNVNVEYRDEVR
jgi:hypothetical protein